MGLWAAACAWSGTDFLFGPGDVDPSVRAEDLRENSHEPRQYALMRLLMIRHRTISQSWDGDGDGDGGDGGRRGLPRLAQSFDDAAREGHKVRWELERLNHHTVRVTFCSCI